MIKFIDSSLQETEATLKIENIQMPHDTQIVTFRSKSAILNIEEIQEEVRMSLPTKELFSFCRDKNTVNTKVNVRIMDISWLISGKKGFLDFVPILEKFQRDNLFQTDFIKSLTHEYWTNF